MFTNILYCDTETFSEMPISNGTYKYAENAEVMLFPYAINDEPPKIWDATLDPKMPEELYYNLMNPKTLTVWHNSMFDRPVLKYSLGIDISTKRIRDTMVLAYMHGLPGGLDKLCSVFKLDDDKAKDKEGRKLIQLFCKPRPKNMKLRRATAETHPAEWEDFKYYALMDIVSMREVYKRLPQWNLEIEHELWRLDQRINDRGFNVDLALAEGAIEAVNAEKKRLARRTHNLTAGEVEAATQRDKLLQHILKQYDVTLPDMTKSTLERRVNDPELPPNVRELLSIRLDASATSVGKYQKLIDGVNKDGRLRGTLQYCGASRTGRWAGRTFQPQNLPRAAGVSQADIENAIPAIQNGTAHLIYDDVIKLTSATIRSCIIPTAGRKLVVSDLSNIEGRVAAWLAGEDWKLRAFYNFDAGTGHDLYKLAYAHSFGVNADTVDKEQRQIGKVQELALGYQGGVGAFVTMASVYGMDLEDLADKAYDVIPEDIKRQAFNFWQKCAEDGRALGLSEDVFIVCDSLKRMWRQAQSNIDSYWYELDTAVRNAIDMPNTVFEARRLRIMSNGAWLRIQLPSRRNLCYPSPQINQKTGEIVYLGVNPYSRQWGRIKTYGGKLFENVCQAVARDVMAANMLPIEEAGYKILLTVHDELITEAPDTDRFSAEDLSRRLATNPQWANGMPLAAGGFEAYRYKKD